MHTASSRRCQSPTDSRRRCWLWKLSDLPRTEVFQSIWLLRPSYIVPSCFQPTACISNCWVSMETFA
ncbi:Uncharacterised protein [Bordetella pertussis]|nr:Uncharacterised protein [Bordetella pertussis]CPO07049.1 Uncharacterised protein [Bordetella pertussis]